MVKENTFRVSAVNICTHRCCNDLFLNEKKHILSMTTQWVRALIHCNNYLSRHSYSVSSAFNTVQNSCGHLLLMGQPPRLLIPTVQLRAWPGWHPLPTVGQAKLITPTPLIKYGPDQLDIATLTMPLLHRAIFVVNAFTSVCA
jgi:hypothetical protein